MDQTSQHARIADLAAEVRIAMLTTRDGDGTYVSRPMAQQDVDLDAGLWFFCERGSRKVAHVRHDPHASVTLSGSSTWVSLSGTVEVVDDRAKARELWNPVVEAWMPQGPDSAEVVLLHVTPDSGEYWDTPGGRVASVLSFVKAKATGRPYDGGDHATVDL